MSQLKIKYAKIQGFTEYVLNTYFEGSFPLHVWNHFLTIGNRTNNHVEGYNVKLKKFIGAKAPNIFKAIEVFQKEKVNSALKYSINVSYLIKNNTFFLFSSYDFFP